MGVVLVNGQPVEVGDQERLNGIQVARRAGVEIPHYCWHAGLTVVASCRMCLVETGTVNKDGSGVTMQPKLVPACQTPARPGTVFVTESDKIKQSRAQVEEALLIDHPIDCPICDKAGECLLQDYHFEHGQKERRADIHPFTSRRRDLGDTVTLFVDRCVMCTRCVRFCREVAGTSELMVAHRGAHEEIDVFPGFPLANKLSGNVVDLCPVGALGDQDFLYQQRVWFMRRHAGVCTGCANGCNIWVEENQDRVYRLKPRENADVNQWWMCDDGRYGFHHVHRKDRVVGVRKRPGGPAIANAELPPDLLEWARLPDELAQALAGSAAAPGRIAAALSPHLTVEEAYLLAKYLRTLDPAALLALGPVPVAGADERYPGGFTIRAEKCPNRLGIEALVRHFSGGQLQTMDDLLAQADAGALRAVWLTGGYPTPAYDAALAARLAHVSVRVVQDALPSPVLAQATYALGGGTFAERDGCYVNHAGRLQYAQYAVRPPVGVWVEGQLYSRLLARPGLYKSQPVLTELAGEIPYFAAAAAGVPNTGLELGAAPSIPSAATAAVGS